MPDYSRLDAEKVHATIVRLQRRIKARFPERNLSRVAGEVAEVAWHVAEHQPPVWIGVLKWTCRTVIAVLALLVPGLILYAIAQGLGDRTHTDWIGIGESAINDLVFAGIAILFLWGLPDRIERARRFRILHRLRSLAHVVDMHQLTKDPDRFQARLHRDHRVDRRPSGRRPALEVPRLLQRAAVADRQDGRSAGRRHRGRPGPVERAGDRGHHQRPVPQDLAEDRPAPP